MKKYLAAALTTCTAVMLAACNAGQGVSPQGAVSSTTSPTSAAETPSEATGGHLYYVRNDYVIERGPKPSAPANRVMPSNPGVYFLAADPENLYWTRAFKKFDDGTILERSTIQGGGIHEIGRVQDAFAIAVADGYLYWANSGGFGRVRTDGSEYDAHFLTVAASIQKYDLAFGDGYLYFIDGGRIGRVSVSDGPQPTVEWITQTRDVVAVTVGGGYVYWCDNSGVFGRMTVGGQDREPRWFKDPGTGIYLGNLVYLDGNIYWSRWTRGQRPTYMGRIGADGTGFDLTFRVIDSASPLAATSP